MNIRLGLLGLVRGLSVDRSERRRLAAAAVALQRQRQSSLAALAPLLRVLPTGSKPKLRLWQALARSRVDVRPHWSTAEMPNALAASIRSTQAYADVAVALRHDRNGFLQRSKDYGQLRRRWIERPPERLLFSITTIAGG